MWDVNIFALTIDLFTFTTRISIDINIELLYI